MSAENISASIPEIQEFLQVWIQSACKVLEQVAGAPFEAAPVPKEELSGQRQEVAESGTWLRFAAEKRLSGEQAFLVPAKNALVMGQLLMAEPPDENAEITDDHRDAVGELFRQFAGDAALTLKAKLDGEVDLQFAGNDRPGWEAVYQAGFRLTNEKTPPLLLFIDISPELGNSLCPPPEAPPAPEASPQATEGPPDRKDLGVMEDTNIGLLMDVELDATLRFGERHMLLRDILDLTPGAVVELDRQIQEPVDLLVGGKVVARGEVVVVEGNYGLRVTEISTPVQRMESLRR